MRMINVKEDQRARLFANRARKYFQHHRQKTSYTDGEIEAGCLFALRFGIDDDCVVVFKLDEFFEPANYQNIIK